MQPHLVFTLLMLMVQSIRCQGGGSNTFGYDASSVCSKPYSRTGRARPENLPCDFRLQNWCTVAGNTYPWHAVRRFVQENQGLMRRMYGDERHINILKAELEKNDVELEYDDRYQRYSDDSRQFQYTDIFESDGYFEELPKEEFVGRSFTSRAFDVQGNGKPSKRFREPAKPHFRPYFPDENPENTVASSRERTTVASSTTGEVKLSTNSTVTSTTITMSNATNESVATSRATDAYSRTDKTGSITTMTTTTAEDLEESDNNRNVSTTPFVTLAQIANIQNLSINEIPGQIDRFDADIETLTELPEIPESTLEENSAIKESFDSYSSRPSEEDTSRLNLQDQIADESQQSQQQFRPRPEYRPTERQPSSTTKSENLETQLYQDVAAKDQQEQPVLKLRGVNACPVKEEVVAPFWANNTRGEVLALLNLYPFEQYVHWEKCTHEHKQMYCRDGCRCEQQYRLHRLLAYDPNNECRGIFSDWFKFPSCCVCRCYDLPIEFRVTSRSPRMQKRKIKLRTVRDPRV